MIFVAGGEVEIPMSASANHLPQQFVALTLPQTP
jgi:hypothetical protein